jgi:hypothetical protein
MLLRKFSLFVLLSTISCALIAKPQSVQVTLQSVEAVKTSERRGDEVFVSIIAYPSSGDPTIARVPMFPMHWLSKELSKVRNVSLWQGTIADDATTLLVITLVEQDLALFNPDDHLGSAQVKITNKNNKITTVWGQPGYKDQPKVEQTGKQNPEYVMFGDNGEYKVRFRLRVGD